MEEILLGSTDRTILVFIADPASTDGGGKTGLTHADLTVSYTRVETDNDVVATDVTSSLSTLSALTDAHADWGVKEVSATLAPGLYRLDVADAVFASGAWYAVVQVTITTSLASATPKAFQLVAYNPLDGVRLGLTALPAAAADAAGGLPISDAGGLDLDSKLANTNEVTAARMGALTDWVNGGRLDLILDIIAADTTTDIPATLTTIVGYIDTEVASILAAVDTEIGTLTTELAKVPKSDGTATWNATALASIQTEANDAIVANNLDHLVLSAVDTSFATTVHTDSVIGQLAQTADAGYDRSTDSLEAQRDNVGTAGAGLTAADDAVITLIGAAGAGLTEAGGDGDHLTAINLPNQTMDIVGNITGNLSGSVGSVSGAVGSVTGAVGSVTGNVGGNVTGSVGSVLGGIGTSGGTITTLDALDTAQDTQHGTTQTAIADVPTNAELATALGTADDATLAAIALLNNLSAADIQTAIVNAGLVLNSTTIATLASQTSFTLTAGSADNDAYNGCVIVITDASTAVQKAVGVILDYTGSTKTVTLANDPAVFTMATTDLVDIIPCRALKPTVDTRTLDVLAGAVVNVDLVDTLTTYTGNTPQTGDSYAIVSSGTHGNAALKTAIDDVPTNAELATSQAAADDATLAAIAALNNLSAAQVNAEVDTALADIHLDHLLAADYDPASKPGVATALLNELVESDAGVSRYTANALEQAPTGGSAPTAAAIADAVWDEAQADHVSAGSFGILASEIEAIDDYIDTEVAAIKAKTDNLPSDPADASDVAAAFSTVNSTLSTIAGYIDTEVAAILAAVDTEVAAIKAKTDLIPAAPAAVGDIPTATTIRDAILNRVLGGNHTTANTPGLLLQLLDADLYVDTSTTPWAMVYMRKGTGGIGIGTELLRQSLKSTAGVNLTSTDTVVGQAIAP